MTDQTDRLAEIRARVEAATPGPWKKIWPCTCEEISVSRDGARIHEELHMTSYDADFIAHAREDIPYLLDELADSFPKTWSGLMAFVDHYYPRDIFTESDDQPGSRIVWLLRQLATTNQERDEALARIERALEVCENGPPAWTVDLRRHIAMVLLGEGYTE